ncbi:precorrin-2/cobalt-factor-2 C20-methyltransferase [Propionibacterium cyclohexanicum]|uniref:Cobalt-precorrin-2 C(20)-methyltransferase n=1 Tax=Propionibacterium cyclohexanicum TaxID=64702 RepID=A0A1H9QCG4_9ACTN|nr:precorrin-2 C(20)-methyltransferase [Propionibacterium cyclohexanicum]SER58110.1 precorrin-2/cobalt-factor-2 C20-methyltransferase [Propionibacterium cyclohexanicum]
MADEHAQHTRRLVGVGVGPGDPQLLTVKAVNLLNSAEVILVPATEGSADGPGRAERIVEEACPGAARRIERIPFSMSERHGVGPKRAESWRASVRAAVDAFGRGARTVVFATIGDPTVYSTFSYLRSGVARELTDVVFELVPGITAMQALAATSGWPLVEGREILALVPATVGAQRLGEVLDVVDTVTVYKGGRTLPGVLDELRRRGRSAVIGTDVSLPGQQIVTLAEVDAHQTLPYFSTVLSTPARTSTGGRI